MSEPPAWQVDPSCNGKVKVLKPISKNFRRMNFEPTIQSSWIFLQETLLKEKGYWGLYSKPFPTCASSVMLWTPIYIPGRVHIQQLTSPSLKQPSYLTFPGVSFITLSKWSLPDHCRNGTTHSQPKSTLVAAPDSWLGDLPHTLSKDILGWEPLLSMTLWRPSY